MDITYLQYGSGQTAYLSCVKDVATRKIVAYILSTTLKISIVHKTLEQLTIHLDGNLDPEAMIHSDQGFHYTHLKFQQRVKEIGLKQSMSRRGNCLDNAPMESFFGHFKDELDYKEAEFTYTCNRVYESLQPYKKAMDIKKDDSGKLPKSSHRSLRKSYIVFYSVYKIGFSSSIGKLFSFFIGFKFFLFT